ncbi:MAG: A24 family peptidase [candidate division KSB1 bacterium]|nr:A24 family peptidase [candidate division KSB1 bacterium]MDZ7351454.1 A24 family peptidase [candidate division KSB1 bacterium]MDZ7355813.1 A24 family peptidase [candidate division KSB1 bacterium]MDZ7384443.1 A24 family peptidase [candidate division KSB1 bacterium]MDZ7398466.1 A24 family peptidase [candidate division KSB1 bacterium]
MLSVCLLFTLGLLLGSFIGVCVHRLPRGKPVVFDVSRCDHCRARLAWRHKLPLLGFLLLHGISHCCGRPIPRQYPLVEAASGVLLLLLYWHGREAAVFLQAVLFVALLLTGMLIDLEHRLIPNKITLPGIGAGLALALLGRQVAWWDALAGIFLCGGLLYGAGFLVENIFKKPNAMGGGDIKFAAMIGAFLGWQQGLSATLLAAGAGALFGLAEMIKRGAQDGPVEIRFGPFLAFGAVVNLLWGARFWQWYFSVSP